MIEDKRNRRPGRCILSGRFCYCWLAIKNERMSDAKRPDVWMKTNVRSWKDVRSFLNVSFFGRGHESCQRGRRMGCNWQPEVGFVISHETEEAM